MKLIVYNMRGEEVMILVNEQLKPGTYEADFDGSNLTSGVYFYRLQSGDYQQTKKMVLIK
ncbi:MAG: T9SS type A sorting domain-containing protein [Chlorobi bacterium]|nr:T9SS type A sorting domain-containing protein [Chlorobiota bacterium]MCI0715904.1 T9SS type A sorting domain-containing protein [Chlorobiota bacterium]